MEFPDWFHTVRPDSKAPTGCHQPKATPNLRHVTPPSPPRPLPCILQLVFRGAHPSRCSSRLRALRVEGETWPLPCWGFHSGGRQPGGQDAVLSPELQQGARPGHVPRCLPLLLVGFAPSSETEPRARFPVPSRLGSRPLLCTVLKLKFCLCPLQAPGGSGLCQRDSPHPAPPCHTFPERCPYLQLLCGFLPLAEPAQEVRKPRLPGQRRVPPVLLAVWPWEVTSPLRAQLIPSVKWVQRGNGWETCNPVPGSRETVAITSLLFEQRCCPRPVLLDQA